MGDVHAEQAPEAPMDPTDPWGTLSAHVVEAKGARGARARPLLGGGCKSAYESPLCPHPAWHRRL